MLDLDALLHDPRWSPYSGWHDDHRAADGTPAYRPAVQQVRAETLALLDECRRRGLHGRCLQLGLGECDASHELLRVFFARVLTIDWRVCALDEERLPGLDTRSRAALALAEAHAPYDLILIDADHSYYGVRADHLDYGPLRSARGLVAFHDALPRPAYPEVEVHRYVAEIGAHTLGTEVGVAWL